MLSLSCGISPDSIRRRMCASNASKCKIISGYILMREREYLQSPQIIPQGLPTSISSRNTVSTSIKSHLRPPLHLTRRGIASISRIPTNLPQYLQHRRRIPVHICQTRITSRGGSVNCRTIPLPAIPENSLYISQRQDLRYQRVDILANTSCSTRSAR